MCLSDIGRVVEVDRARHAARVEITGTTAEVSTLVLDLDGRPVEVGAWLVIHTGLAVERLTDRDARRVLGARAALVPADDTRQDRP
jgi:hydrogenase assembly chaperone HypC/HupF